MRSTVELTNDWLSAKSEYDHAKKREQECRDALIRRVSHQPKGKGGTETIPIQNAGLLKIEHRLYYKLDTKMSEFTGSLRRIELLTSAETVSKLILYKPELSLKEFGTLAPKARRILDKHLSVTVGVPTVSFKPFEQPAV